MKQTTLILCSLLVCAAQSLNVDFATPLLLAMPLSMTIQSANGFTRGFFSLFRRRGKQETTTPEPDFYGGFPSAPSGPVSYAVQRPPGFSYPFQYGLGAENDMFAQYSRLPGFSNLFQGDFGQPDHVRNPGMIAQGVQDSFDSYRGGRAGEAPAMNPEDAESFFTLLAETDEHQCISRLVCEMGASPETAGEFAQSVNEVFSTLQHFPPGSKVSHYSEIIQLGSTHGLAACATRFQTCDEESYNLVKNAQLSDEQSNE